MTRHGTSRDQTGPNLRKDFPKHWSPCVESMGYTQPQLYVRSLTKSLFPQHNAIFTEENMMLVDQGKDTE